MPVRFELRSMQCHFLRINNDMLFPGMLNPGDRCNDCSCRTEIVTNLKSFRKKLSTQYYSIPSQNEPAVRDTIDLQSIDSVAAVVPQGTMIPAVSRVDREHNRAPE